MLLCFSSEGQVWDKKGRKSSTENELLVRRFPKKEVPDPDGKTGSVRHFA